jgi:Icc-related predicted phosphoesterase
MVAVVCIADTHSMHEKVQIPDGDILIHAGDITNIGSISDLERFAYWMRWLPHKMKVVIAGNHDFCFQSTNAGLARKILEDHDICYLQDSGTTYRGLSIWGSPWVPKSGPWAFGVSGAKISRYWDAIPENTDILVTHVPPRGILDRALEGENCGCQYLRPNPAPRLHVFGHIHEAYGQITLNGNREYINASICTREYKPTNKPIVVEI